MTYYNFHKVEVDNTGRIRREPLFSWVHKIISNTQKKVLNKHTNDVIDYIVYSPILKVKTAGRYFAAERNKKMFKTYYGIGVDSPAVGLFSEVCKDHNISKERCRQIVNRLTKELRYIFEDYHILTSVLHENSDMSTFVPLTREEIVEAKKRLRKYHKQFGNSGRKYVSEY
jgi:hypothetical protein